MPVLDVSSMGDTVSTLHIESLTSPTMTVTINPGQTDSSGNNDAGSPNSLSSGVTAGIAVVSVLVVICVVTAAILHVWSCRNPGCKVRLIVRCGKRKPPKEKGQVSSKQLSSAPTFTRSFDITPVSPEKSKGCILDRSPLDRHFLLDGEGGTTLAPQLQEIGGKKPCYSDANSIVSDVALLTTPPIVPATVSPTVLSTPLKPAEQLDQEVFKSAAEGDRHPPTPLNTALSNAGRWRHSNGSGFLSIITLPSFITNDRPRTLSSFTAAKLESPVQPQSHSRKQSSNLSQRVSAADSGTLLSPASDGDGSSKKSRPISAALQIITSALKRSSSTSFSLRSSSPSSRRSSRRSLGRQNPSLAVEDEAVIQWRKLPPIPTVQGTPTMQNFPSQRSGEVKDSPTERLFSYIEEDPRRPFFLAPQIPLPPSPSAASSVSSLAYASSPQEISPINGFTVSYLSRFPLPPSLPSTPRSFIYPPLPPSLPPTPRSFVYPPLPPSLPPTPRSFVYPPLPPSIPSTPRKFSLPPLPPFIPSTPGTFIYPSLPPSLPSTPGQSSYPPLPPSAPSTPSSTDKFMDVHTSNATDRPVSLTMDSLRRPSGKVCRAQQDLNLPTTGTDSVLPGNNDGPYGDGTRQSAHRRKRLAYSQSSGLQELMLPPRSLSAFPSSPPPPMSPRGPRPRPPTAPGQLSRSGTWHSQTSSGCQ